MVAWTLSSANLGELKQPNPKAVRMEKSQAGMLKVLFSPRNPVPGKPDNDLNRLLRDESPRL
jgi:hypothetical protein